MYLDEIKYIYEDEEGDKDMDSAKKIASIRIRKI